MQLQILLDKINSLFPFETAMPGDKVGLQIETDANTVSGVLFTLEVTEAVVNECKRLNFNTIVTFHPLIYSDLSYISLGDRVGALCSLLIKNSINLISVHTAFDAHIHGTSSILAGLLGLKGSSFLVPDAHIAGSGMGVIASPKATTTLIDLVRRLSACCGSPVRYCGSDSNEISRIAIVGGSGTSFVDAVINNKCDCFVTADVRYHQFHAAQNHFALIDVGHYEMEQFVPKAMRDMLSDFLDDKDVKHLTSKVLTNPIQYYPNNNYLETQINNL